VAVVPLEKPIRNRGIVKAYEGDCVRDVKLAGIVSA
jgi:hypothetical protein